MNRIKQQWSKGEPAASAWCSSGNPLIAELLAHRGFDAVVIDWQHGIGIGHAEVVNCIRAIGTSSALPMVRVPSNSPEYIGHALDAGAYGVIVPMVESFEEAVAAGRSCRYPPRGARSVARSRPAFSESLGSYVDRANDDVICLVMIETAKGLEQVERIASAPGIDGLYIGPVDLSLDMGLSLTDWMKDERHLAAVDRVFAAARANGIAPCHHGGTAEVALEVVKRGSMLSQIFGDFNGLTGAAAGALDRFRSGR